MNLREFTEAVDQNIEIMGKNELKCFVHNITRKIPETKRSEFLELLYNIRENGNLSDDEKNLQIAMHAADEQEIKEEFSRLQSLFHQIEDQELFIHADGYEDYSQGFWSDSWVWEYEDPEHICRAYIDGCKLVQRCVNDRFYRNAIEVFGMIMETEVLVENDWDDFSMGLEELVKEELISVDLEKLALHVLYASYQTEITAMRPQELFNYFSVPFFENISLVKMLGIGQEELVGLSDFWDLWIKLMIGKTGNIAERLLKEAILYQYGEGGILEIARTAYQSHPVLYLEAVEYYGKINNFSRQMEIAIEALEKIEKKYIIRSEIALKAAEAASWLGKTAQVEECWLETFLSNSKPVNYLRLVAESKSIEKQWSTIEKGIRIAKIGNNVKNMPQELYENYISENDKEILWFLSGDFTRSMELCCNVNQALGWSGKFIKCGIPLFLLLLLKREDLGPGCKYMEETVIHHIEFDANLYLRGTKNKVKFGENSTEHQDNREVFWQCFKNWKRRYCLDEKQQKQYLSNLEKLIDMRVKAILDGKFRNHYESVAALAAALGEVKESWGETGIKDKILQEYRQIYTYRSTFHAELRKYGMGDNRKKKIINKY